MPLPTERITAMKTAQTDYARCTAPDRERKTIINEILAAFAGLTREQKIAYLERLEALAGDDVTKEEAAD